MVSYQENRAVAVALGSVPEKVTVDIPGCSQAESRELAESVPGIFTPLRWITWVLVLM